ncbi:hypothetical protein [Candidatus Poriferisodalis sp.]|uniref:hypothetical protein n=1 Tax=Candidatus Poriferisodalis sp. TaxID=3101277 RepID=UPI003B02C49D
MAADTRLSSERGRTPSATGLNSRAGTKQNSRQARVIAGGVLCATAALGLWWAFEQAAAEPETRFAVARSRLAPGRVIEAADVAMVSIRLPTEVEATVFGAGADVVGGLVVEAVHAGELLTRGDIGSPQSISGRHAGYAISVELDRPRALNGLVAVGERVDLVVSGHLSPDSASVVATGAVVLDVDDPSSIDHVPDTVIVTLQVPDQASAVSVAAAANAGAITLIRAWGASPQVTS